MALLCGISFYQPTWQRVIICAAFCSEFWLHAWLDHMGFLNNVNYYFSGGVFTSLVLAGIVFFAKRTRFTDDMAKACFASILLNAYGWLIYDISWPAYSYELAFLVLYLIIASIFVQKEGVEDEDARWGNIFISCNKRSFSALQTIQKEKT
jgi:hypothetical protein